MSRGIFFWLGALLLLGAGSASLDGHPRFSSSAEMMGYFVGLYGIPLGLMAFGLSRPSPPGSADGGPAPGGLSPVTKIAIGCLGVVVLWIGAVMGLAVVARLTGP